MVLTTTSRFRFDQFIQRVARKASIVYNSRYQDIEDYIQIGNLTLWRIKQQWNNENREGFIPYARLAIAREIRRAAIQSTCVVSGPYRAKVQAIQAKARFAAGHSEKKIQQDLRLITKWDDDKEWIALRGMIMDVFGESVLLNFAVDDLYPYNLVLEDILAISLLTDEERQAIRTAADQSEIIPEKIIKCICKKLGQGGY